MAALASNGAGTVQIGIDHAGEFQSDACARGDHVGLLMDHPGHTGADGPKPDQPDSHVFLSHRIPATLGSCLVCPISDP